jgi:hypothetical protein
VAVYLKLYNKASATQADTPVATYCIPTSGGAEGAGFTINFEGLEFATACSFRVTTEVADSGTTSPATNAVILNVEHSQCGVAAITGA